MKIVILSLQPIVAMILVGLLQTQQAQVAQFHAKSDPAFQPPSFMRGR
jgi:hypothetical protein